MLSRGFKRRLYQLISIILCITMVTECSPLMVGPALRPRPSPAPAVAAMHSPQASKGPVSAQPQPVPHPPSSGSPAATPSLADHRQPGLAAAAIQPPSVPRPATPDRAASSAGPPAGQVLPRRLASGALAANIPLVAGWNLVSIPEEPGDTDPASVLSSIAGSYNLVYAYDGCDDEDPWKLYDPAAPPPASDLTAIDHRIGFWIEMTEAATLSVDGTKPTSTAIQLCQGWNLIGYPLDRAWPIADILAPIAGKYTLVFAYDPTDPNDPWEVYDVRVPAWANDLQVMEPGRGYWVYATEGVTLIIEEPPPTPTPTATPTPTPTPTATPPAVGQPPTAQITSPAEGAEVTDFVDIIGTADDPDGDLVEYRLQYRQVGTNGTALRAQRKLKAMGLLQEDVEWTTFATGNAPVVNGVLGTLDPTLMLNGMFEIRLLAIDSEGQRTTASVHLVITGGQKVGHFRLTFKDLEIPVSGLNLIVWRTYDSRDKRVGDFGVGWTMGLVDVQVAENQTPGEGWVQTKTCSFGACTYCIESTRPHIVTVTLPGGEVQQFAVTVSPQCQAFWPIRFAKVTFTPLRDTTSSLAQSTFYDDVTVEGSIPGPVELWSDRCLPNQGCVNALYDPFVYGLRTRDGTSFEIDEVMGLQSIADRNGNTLNFELSGITHSTGKSITFQRDGLGRITRITDPMGQSLTYAYDANGDLVSVTDREGNVTTFTYDGNHRLLEIHDPLGRTPARNEYDADGRLIATTDANNNRIEFGHDLNARVEAVTDRLGNRTLVAYDERGNVLSVTDPLGNTTRHTYDDDDNRLTTTDPYGNTTSWTYNAQGDVLSITDPLGNTTTFTYDSAGRLLTSTDPLGHTFTNTYDTKGNLLTATDAMGHMTSYTYDASGNVTSMTDPLGRTTEYEYDANGFPTGVTDPMGHKVTIQYDDVGRPTGQIYTRTTALGIETISTQTEYDANGNMVAYTDWQGQTSTYEYDAVNQLTSFTDAAGRSMHWEYDLVGQPTREEQPGGVFGVAEYDAEGRMTARTDHLGRTSGFEYDPLGRLVGVETHDGVTLTTRVDALGRPIENTALDGAVYLFQYDEAGRLVAQSSRIAPGAPEIVDMTYTYDDAGQMVAQQDALGRTVSYTYDANGQLIETTFNDGSSIRQAYDAAGQVISTTDQAGNTTLFGYDANGRLVVVTDTLGMATTYTYDELGNLLTATDANGRTTRYQYDASGRLTTHTLPLGMSERWVYDEMGRLVAYEGFNGGTTTLEYDVRNRPVRKTYPDGSVVDMTYTVTGTLATVDSPAGTITYVYDSNNLLSRVTYPHGGWITYTHAADGKRLAMGTPEGVTYYTYDGYGRLETVTDPDGGVTTYGYDVVGNRTLITYPNGTVTRYTYDDLNRLTSVVNYRSDLSVISAYTYTVDITGRRVQVQEFDGTNTRTVNYVYDDLYRLTAEQVTDPISGTYTISYTYDAVGNRLTKTDPDGTTTYAYDTNDRLITEILPDGTQVLYDYDAAGNLTQVVRDGVTTTYTYDARNRLVGISSSTGITATYTYAHNGVRLSRSDANGTVYYVTDVAEDAFLPRVVMEIDGAGRVLAGYTYGDGLAPLSMARGTSRYYYHPDGHQSTGALTNDAEAVTDRYVYDAWGNLLRRSGSTPNDFLYNGQQYDTNAGYYFLRARYYDPQVGRFITRDPVRGSLRDPLELNPYLYARADPVNMADPSGLFSLTEMMVVQAIIGILASILITAILHTKVASYMPAQPFLGSPQATLFEFSVSLMFSKWKTVMRFLPVLALVSIDLSLQALWYHAGYPSRIYFFYAWSLSTGSDKVDPDADWYGFSGGLVYDIHRAPAEEAPETALEAEKYLKNNYAGPGYSAVGAVPNMEKWKLKGQPTLFASKCGDPPCTYGFTVPIPPESGWKWGAGYGVTTGPIFFVGAGGIPLPKEVPSLSTLKAMFAKLEQLRANPRPLPNRTLRPIDAYFYVP